MNVIALVRDVVRVNDSSKTKAVVTIETESPLEIHDVRLFEQSLADGSVAAFESVKGKVVQVPVQVGAYNGRPQLNMPRGYPFIAPAAKS